MDEATFRCLLDAYDYGSFNGRSPADIYEDWEQGAAPPEVPLCSICRKEHHGCAMASSLRPSSRVKNDISKMCLAAEIVLCENCHSWHS